LKEYYNKMEYTQKRKEIRAKLVWSMNPISRTVLKKSGMNGHLDVEVSVQMYVRTSSINTVYLTKHIL